MNPVTVPAAEFARPLAAAEPPSPGDPNRPLSIDRLLALLAHQGLIDEGTRRTLAMRPCHPVAVIRWR